MSIGDQFKKLTSKNPLEKVVGAGLGSLGKALGDKLAASGSDSSVVRKIGSIASDALLSGASNEFFNFGGLTSRIGGRDLELSRFSGNSHFSTVTPDGKMTAKGYQNLSYPSDLGEYYISFEIVDYKRPTPFVQATWNSRCTINLPIPGQLIEGHQVSWRDDSTGVIGAIADAYAQSQAGQDVDWEGVLAQGAINYGIKYISEDSAGAIGQIAGGIPNPNMSMFFQGPTFQEQQFEWTFAPQTPDESFLIKAMIQQFRISMLPTQSVAGSSNFLNYPKAVQMKLHAGGAEADHLFKMKKAVIPAINVNYSPNGHPQFFRGTKAPKYINFKLHLKSIEYWLASDFDSSVGGQNDWSGTLDRLGATVKGAATSIFDQLGGE